MLTDEEKQMHEIYSDEAIVFNKFKNIFSAKDWCVIVTLISLRLLFIFLYSFLYSVPIGLIMIFLMPLELPVLILYMRLNDKYYSKAISYRRISEAVPVYLGSVEDASSIPKYKVYTKLCLSLLLSIVISLIYVGVRGI